MRCVPDMINLCECRNLENTDTTVSETIKVSNSFDAYILINQNGDVVGNTFFTEANKPEILIPEHHLVKVKIQFVK